MFQATGKRTVLNPRCQPVDELLGDGGIPPAGLPDGGVVQRVADVDAGGQAGTAAQASSSVIFSSGGGDAARPRRGPRRRVDRRRAAGRRAPEWRRQRNASEAERRPCRPWGGDCCTVISVHSPRSRTSRTRRAAGSDGRRWRARRGHVRCRGNRPVTLVDSRRVSASPGRSGDRWTRPGEAAGEV